MNILGSKHLLVENINHVNFIADHLSQSGTIAVIDLGTAKGIFCDGWNKYSEARLWNTKQRLSGKIWGTVGDEEQILELVETTRLSNDLKTVFTKSFLKHLT